MESFINNIKRKFAEGTMLIKIIYINIAVFFVLRLIGLGCVLFNIAPHSIIRYVEVPSSLVELIYTPWTVITYMFAQYDVLHILFNMIWFYWFGNIFMQFFTQKQMSGLYLLGGLGGALLFIVSYNLFPYFTASREVGYLIGASASVIAIVVATAMYAPNYTVRLFIFGDVKLKWIAVITIVIDLMSITSDNAGGHIAHIGGAIVGALFISGLRRGKDYTRWINVTIDWLVGLFSRCAVGRPIRSRSNRTASPPPPQQNQSGRRKPTKEEMAKIDAILDKIKQSGYKALTPAEKALLFDYSNSNK